MVKRYVDITKYMMKLRKDFEEVLNGADFTEEKKKRLFYQFWRKVSFIDGVPYTVGENGNSAEDIVFGTPQEEFKILEFVHK